MVWYILKLLVLLPLTRFVSEPPIRELQGQ